MRNKLFVVVLVVLGALGFLLTRDWDSPELGQALLDKASEATEINMKASGFRLNLLEGIVLDEVEASSDAPGRSFELDMDRLVFEHRLVPLLLGRVQVERIVLERPKIELVDTVAAGGREPKEKAVPPTDEKLPSPGQGGLSLEIDEILVNHASLVIRSQKGTETSTMQIQELDLEIRNLTFEPGQGAPMHAFSGEGELEIRETTFDNLKIQNAKGQFKAQQGRFEISPLSFQTGPGHFVADLAADFNTVPFDYQLSLKSDSLDFNTMAGMESQGFGPGALDLKASGVGTDSKDLEGRGVFQLEQGKLPAAPLFSRIDEKLGRQVVVGAPYKNTELRVGIANNVITWDPFPLEMERAKLQLKGWVNLEGPLRLDMTLGTVREGIRIDGVGDNLLDVLTDENGWVMIPIAVSGTRDDPRVRPDAQALLAQAGQGAKRLAKDKATDTITGFFRKKKH